MSKQTNGLLEEGRYPSDATIQESNFKVAFVKLPIDEKLYVEKVNKEGTPRAAGVVVDSLAAIGRGFLASEEKFDRSMSPRAADMNAPRAAVGTAYFPENPDEYVRRKMLGEIYPLAVAYSGLARRKY